MQKQRHTFRLILFLMIMTLLLTGCNKWKRFSDVETISIVSITYRSSLASFNSKGSISSSLEDTSDKVSLNEIGQIGKTLLKPKQAVKAGIEIVNERERIQDENRRNVNTFKSRFHQLLTDSINQSSLSAIPYEFYDDYVDISNNRYTQKLLLTTKADALLKAHIAMGFIVKKIKFGLSTSYTLCAKGTLYLADEKGIIGEKTFFVNTSITKNSPADLPEFTTEDYAVLESEVEKKLADIVQEITSK